MKFITKTLTVAAVIAMGHTAFAANNVYVSGSSAFRKAVLTQLGTAGAVFDAAPTEAYAGTDPVGATFANFTGLVGGVSTTVKVSFTGSAGGIFTVAHNGDATPPKAIFLADGASGSGLANPTTVTGDVHLVDMALSDAYQSSSVFPTPGITTDSLVGVVTFKWCGNYSLAQNSASGTAITDITAQGAKAIFSGASLTNAAILTGSTNAADKTILVVAEGRDFDSGTRINAFADTGVGTTTSPVQLQPFLNATVTGTVGSGGTNDYIGTPQATTVPGATDQFVTKLRKWNNNASYPLYNGTLTVPSVDGGFASGGDLSKFMRCDTNNNAMKNYYNTTLKGQLGYANNATGIYMVTYLGIGDAATLTNATGLGVGAGKELTYNGVTYSNNAIEQGKYTFWSYEHLFANDLSTAGSAQATAVYNNLANTLTNNPDASENGAGLRLDQMIVNRAGDGGAIGFDF